MEVSGEKVNSLNERTVARSDCAGEARRGREISITDSQTDGRRGYYFSIRSTDYITRDCSTLSLSFFLSVSLVSSVSVLFPIGSRHPFVRWTRTKFSGLRRATITRWKRKWKRKKKRRFRVAAETESLSVLANKIY